MSLEKLLISLQQENTICLTANQRQSNQLQQLFQKKQNQNAWRTPKIISINLWTQQLWQQAILHNVVGEKILLNNAQELLLWQQIIAKQNDNLLNVAQCAQQVQQAFHLLTQWQINLNESNYLLNEEHQQFLSWRQNFIDVCDKKNFIDHSTATHRVIDIIPSLKLPKQIWLYGFIDLTPLDKALLEKIESRNIQIFVAENKEQTATIIRHEFPTPQDEIYAIAEFAKQKMKSDQTIALVLPKLSQQRKAIIEKFNEVLFEDLSFDERKIPINISGGESLADYPLIQSAFHCLNLLNQLLSYSQIHPLIHSPFIKTDSWEHRSKLDFMIRQQNLLSTNLDKLIEICQQQCTVLSNQLHELSTKKQKSITQSHQHWAQLFVEVLQCFQWTEQRQLSSVEYQLTERFKLLLDEFCQLDIIHHAVDLNAAIANLTQLAKNTLFQPKTQTSRIQLLEVLEAAGLNFDYIWFAQLDDNHWPPAANPNAFIPFEIQRQAFLPHSSAQRELHFSQEIMAGFQQHSQHFIVSHSSQQQDNEVNPSALIKAFPVSICEFKPTQFISTFIQQQTPTQTWSVDYKADINKENKIHGGSSILQDQAACPFRAFVLHRLKSLTVDDQVLGINALNKGKFIHDVLEKLWLKISDQQTLKKLNPTELNLLIDNALDASSRKIFNNQQKPFVEIEKQRVKTILQQYFSLELQRPDFSVIAVEQKRKIQLADISFNIRLDRIDKIEQGYLVVDYKTSNPSVNAWFDDRPDDPQLPLYCLTDEAIIGATFVRLRTNAVEFKGVSKTEFGFKNLLTLDQINQKFSIESWQQLLNYWRVSLEKLAQEFSEGIATVAPKYGAASCQYCPCQSLCGVEL